MGDFLAKLILMLSIFGLFLFLINKFLRKWLNVEKKKLFSYNHVNDKHKKIDWTIRIIFIFFLFISLFININRDPLKRIWFLETHILLFVFIIVSETVRVIMEKRYAENKNDYIFSAIQLVIISIFLLSVFSTDIFGLFG
ncbi:DUF4181 domain-containing protein [Lysinibacillus yapensis]|uniref:DUF4181 domain-containing protein n=1 Tax=Ureibacillus yapensis TaxID=2304605 RepID=UPI001F4180D3|nr:DUF4181 domain-containing protein [Lysinibacillus yapensis]